MIKSWSLTHHMAKFSFCVNWVNDVNIQRQKYLCYEFIKQFSTHTLVKSGNTHFVTHHFADVQHGKPDGNLT